MTEIQTLIRNVRQKIESMDSHIAELERRRERMRRAWHPRAEALRRLEYKIDRAAEDYRRSLHNSIARAADPESYPASAPNILAAHGSFDEDALAFFFGDQIKTRLLAELEAIDWRVETPDAKDGSDPDTRDLAALDDQIEKARTEREALRAELQQTFEA